MTATEWIVTIAAFAAAAVLAVMSVISFLNRGPVLNNAYLYASEEERKTMDKKPFYRQSAVIFLLLCIVFAIIGVSVLLHDSRINLLEIPFALGAIIYAVVSTARIGR